MTGPEHYREAEQCLDAANQIETGDRLERFLLGSAQVHATLALAAAAALDDQDERYKRGDWESWLEVAGPKMRGGQ